MSPPHDDSFKLECSICLEHDKLKRLKCFHTVCATCLETHMSNSAQPLCPLCRRVIEHSADDYPLIETEVESGAHSKREPDLCQMEECDRKLDHYCTCCKLFLCYRHGRNKGSRCGELSAHTILDVADLLPLAQEYFQDWQSTKKKDIGSLNSKISEQALKLSEMTNPRENISIETARATLQLTRKLLSLSVEAVSEHETLNYYGKLETADGASERQLVTFMQLLSKDQEDSSKSKQIQEMSLKSTESIDCKETGNQNLEKNIPVTEGEDLQIQLISKQLTDVELTQSEDMKGTGQDNAKKSLHTSKDSSKIMNSKEKTIEEDLEKIADRSTTKRTSKAKNYDRDTRPKSSGVSLSYSLLSTPIYESGDDDEMDLQQIGGYLPLQVQRHDSMRCKFKRNLQDVEHIRVSSGMGSASVPVYNWNLECHCGKRSSFWEKHYSKACKWNRVIDEVEQKAYLIRKCRCTRPPGY